MKLCLATHNEHKAKEMRALLPSLFEVITLKSLDYYDDIPETGQTFRENAFIKANHIYQKYKINAIADDSGLEVEALQGAPGVYSARYAGEPANDERNITKLLLDLRYATDRKANFISVICLILNGEAHYFEGKIFGTITNEKVGTNGFGYDPIFVPEGYNITFAEMDASIKNTISHRAIAMNKFKDYMYSIYK
ncbi:MAG: RdgB/HAM1 family non-canonical purine NTP pyrophosphatase [Cytophagales bacterium]|nr:RdgB/HAM1 family non-canonical purine NTP pyrophosphatase [Cytophagales bacterium]